MTTPTLSTVRTDLPAGTKVRVLTQDSGHCLVGGTVATVTSEHSDPYYLRAIGQGVGGGEVAQYLNPEDIALHSSEDFDALGFTLNDYKAAVVRTMYEHKVKNTWCGVAEYVARTQGLMDYLPVQRTVRVTQTVSVQQWPGEADRNVLRRARNEDRNRYYTESNEFADDGDTYRETDGSEQAPVIEDDTIEAFKARLGAAAVKGARDHGVQGVPDFLRDCGIDPDAIRATSRVFVTLAVEVEHGSSEDPHALARTLVEDVEGEVTEVWGG